jgi:hypothetical protein
MKLLINTWIFLLLAGCGTTIPKGDSEHPPDHNAYTVLLKMYVNNDGLVNYKGFINDKEKFQQYLDLLSNTPPSGTWSKEEQMAYWINAYNAFTIKLIMDYYPVKSIKDIGSSIQIPFVNTPWQKKFIKIGNEEMKLDEIEHQVLRKKFDDPRIHFALVCASRSCPRLINEAYTADKLDKQLDSQAKYFLSNTQKNKITADKPQLSNYFKWYKGDFTKNGSVIDYVNKYSKVKINANADIVYLDYDWSLNEQ